MALALYFTVWLGGSLLLVLYFLREMRSRNDED